MDTIPPIGRGPDSLDGSFDSLSGEITHTPQKDPIVKDDLDGETVIDGGLGMAFADTHHETPAVLIAPPIATAGSRNFEVSPWDIKTGPVAPASTTVAATVEPIADRIAEALFASSPLSDAEIAQETTAMYRAEIQRLKELCNELKKINDQIEDTWSHMNPMEMLDADVRATNERFSLKAQINTLMCIVIPDILSSLEKAGVTTFTYDHRLDSTTSEQIPVQLGKAESVLTVSRTSNNGNEYVIKRPQKTPDDTSRNSIYLHADDSTGALLFASYRQATGAPQDVLHLVGPRVAETANNINLVKMGRIVTQITESLIEKLESSRDEKR